MKPAPPVTRYLAMVSSYRVVGETELAQIDRIVNIASVEDHRLFEQSFDARKIRPAKFIPRGQNQQRRGAVQRVIISMRVLDAVAEDFSRFFHRLRIECLHSRA